MKDTSLNFFEGARASFANPQNLSQILADNVKIMHIFLLKMSKFEKLFFVQYFKAVKKSDSLEIN